MRTLFQPQQNQTTYQTPDAFRDKNKTRIMKFSVLSSFQCQKAKNFNTLSTVVLDVHEIIGLYNVKTILTDNSI